MKAVSLLALDVGNSNIVLGWFGLQPKILLWKKWRLTTHKSATSDEYLLWIKHLLALEDRPTLPQAVVFSSVVPPLNHVLTAALQKLFALPVHHIHGNTQLGMKLDIDFPDELGADRLINAYEAYRLHQKSCIVIDLGTATTFDCISEDGHYLGGAIAPGLQLSLQTLLANTAKLPGIELKTPTQAIGKNTKDSMRSGLLFGYASMIDGMVCRLTKEMKHQPKVIATGGLANMMHSLCEKVDLTAEDLTICGMANIYKNFFAAPNL